MPRLWCVKFVCYNQTAYLLCRLRLHVLSLVCKACLSPSDRLLVVQVADLIKRRKCACPPEIVGILLGLQLKDADPHAASKGQNPCVSQSSFAVLAAMLSCCLYAFALSATCQCTYLHLVPDSTVVLFFLLAACSLLLTCSKAKTKQMAKQKCTLRMQRQSKINEPLGFEL